MEIVKFNQSLIAFDFDSEMVNATDMLKAFPEKRMNNYLRQKATIEFIKHLEKSETLNSVSNVIQIVKGNFKGGKTQGTWMCKWLAYDFASWLNVEFKLFVYRTFDQSMQVKLAEQNEKLWSQQRQLDYFWDKSDQNDIYRK